MGYNNRKRISFRYNDKSELINIKISTKVKSGADDLSDYIYGNVGSKK